MPQEAEEGKRFARDMRRIREARNLSIGDLHDETKIPVGLIQAFEETGLFDHPQFNRVYLRSFVRTYANVVGIDADGALESLEEALAGRYTGSLAAEYLEDEKGPADAEDVAERPHDTGEEDSRTPKESERDATTSRIEAEGLAEQSRDDRDEEEREPPIVSTTGEAAASSRQDPRKEQSAHEEEEEEEEEVDEDWAAQSPPSGRRTSAGTAVAAGAAGSAGDRSGTRRTGAGATGSRRSRDASGTGGLDRRWLIAGAMVIVVAAVVWILIAMLGGDADDQQAGGTVTPADTTQAADTTGPPMQAAQSIELPAIGDTMNVYVVAAQGAVDPIRVTVDDDLRRPYWIDQGDSMAFNPTDRIVVEELLDNINLKVEGIPYPTDRRDAQGRIVITRDTLQNYFASLEDDPGILDQFGGDVGAQLQGQDEDQQNPQDQQP